MARHKKSQEHLTATCRTKGSRCPRFWLSPLWVAPQPVETIHMPFWILNIDEMTCDFDCWCITHDWISQHKCWIFCATLAMRKICGNAWVCPLSVRGSQQKEKICWCSLHCWMLFGALIPPCAQWKSNFVFCLMFVLSLDVDGAHWWSTSCWRLLRPDKRDVNPLIGVETSSIATMAWGAVCFKHQSPRWPSGIQKSTGVCLSSLSFSGCQAVDCLILQQALASILNPKTKPPSPSFISS